MVGIFMYILLYYFFLKFLWVVVGIRNRNEKDLIYSNCLMNGSRYCCYFVYVSSERFKVIMVCFRFFDL